MTTEDKTSRGSAGERMRRALVVRQSLARGDGGQALVLSLIVILLISLLVPVVLANVLSENTNSAHGTDFESALAAAEAGVQQYRNLLDVDSNYWRYSSSSLPPAGDPALVQGGWQKIPNTQPAEWFHYLPNIHFLPTGSGPNTPAVLLTVTGRAGAPHNYSYRTIQVTFETTGLLTDAYFSQYETLDPQQDTAQATVKNGSGSNQTQTTLTPYAVSLPTAVPSTNGTTENLWGALCQYDDWQPNVFIDSLSGANAIANPYKSGNYNGTYPYYGPWRGNEPNSRNNSNTFTYTTGSGSTYYQVSVADPCGPVYNFVNGEHFEGPVYTDDQLWICNPGGNSGSGPTFSDGIEVGDMPSEGFPYAYTQWPAQPQSTAPGWIDDGSLNWDSSCGGNQSSNGQSFGTAGVRGVPQVTPQNVDTALLTEAEVNGCVYTGPTMIEFVAGGTYNVWSPGSAGTTTGYGTEANSCGTFSSASTVPYFVTGLSIPSSGLVMYVNNIASSTTPPGVQAPGGTLTAAQLAAQLSPYITEGALPASATCLNPWKPYSPSTSQVNSQTCAVVSREGDVVVEGEVEGQVTLSAENNIIVSRDLTYECADSSGSGGVSQQASSSYTLATTCYTETTPDVLGLVADGDVVISKPAELAGQTGVAGTCTSESVGCSPTTPPVGSSASTDDNVPTQTEPYEWPAINPPGNNTNEFCGQQGVGTQDGTETTQTVGDVVPDCQLQNPVIDAAVVALGGSLADEDWDAGPNNAGSAWIYGTDVSWVRGPFGLSGDTGYYKEFSYDTRLLYLSPPEINLVAGLTWNASNWVTCGSVNDVNVTNPSAAGVCPVINGISG
jgi:hypothetical protein